jgi:hypothetical protein
MKQGIPNELIGFISVQYRQLNVSEDVLFVLSCRNVPTGSIVSLSCNQGGPEPPVDLPPTPVTNDQQFALGKLCYIPANFNGIITIRYTFFVLPIPADCSIELIALIPVSADDERYAQGVVLSDLNLVCLNLQVIPNNIRFIKQDVTIVEHLSA